MIGEDTCKILVRGSGNGDKLKCPDGLTQIECDQIPYCGLYSANPDQPRMYYPVHGRRVKDNRLPSRSFVSRVIIFITEISRRRSNDKVECFPGGDFVHSANWNSTKPCQVRKKHAFLFLKIRPKV